MTDTRSAASAASRVELLREDADDSMALEESLGRRAERSASRSGMGLALSGGGYRASLFGLGSLWRLNELGWLKSLRRVTSVSGGSLTAGVLAARWRELDFDAAGCAVNFPEIIAGRLRQFCSRTLDRKAILCGLIPFVSAAGVARRAYERGLVKLVDGRVATLADLPTSGDGPEFIFYATCLQTGSSFRFTRDGLHDWKLGRLPRTDVTLGTALAASAAFPPFLAPLRLRTDAGKWVERPKIRDLEDAPRIRARLSLADGGIYDNMGIEALWRSMQIVLVSDAGAPFAYVTRPWANWPSQLGRVRDILIEQTRALRKRMLIGELQEKYYSGVYWGINTRIDEYTANPALSIDGPVSQSLARITTRLRALDASVQERLINWGYSLADAAIRAHVDASIPRGRLPYPANAL
ncbi:MAG: patatin-like phospholipase family protein [Gammaproteobacteria bacterium]|nr:patatin-like phospholipase family protein [Gammaproteobacteria bacterium]